MPHAWAVPADMATAIPMPASMAIGTSTVRPGGPLRHGTGGRGHRDVGSGWAGGQVLQEVPQLAPGPGAQGPSGSVFELVGRQPTRLEVFTQVRQDRVAVGIGSLHLYGGVVPWRGVHVFTVLGGGAPAPMPDATGWR